MTQKSSEQEPSYDGGPAESFVRHFFFGASDIQRDGRVNRATLLFDARTQGWVGIPHGGIGMGAVAELAATLDDYPDDEALRFPLSLEYRLGGSPARIGDTAVVEVASGDGQVSGKITVNRDPSPYLTAVVRYGIDSGEEREQFMSSLPGNAQALQNDWMPLPCYKYCFVCGTERKEAGLKRTFHLLKSALPEKIIVSPIGADMHDLNSFCRFQRGGLIHPVAFLALLDETVGWGGFMTSGSGGVTVRIRYTFYRDISPGERVLVIGRGDKVRGSAASRLLYWGSGGAVVVHDDGRLEPVITVSGQFLGVPELTQQMRVELAPPEQTQRAFALAGS
jgi:hypothetical protein